MGPRQTGSRGSWPERALAAAWRFLEKTAATPPQAEEAASRSRELVLESMTRKWFLRACDPPEKPERLAEIMACLPSPPALNSLGLFDAAELFLFAEAAERLLDCTLRTDKGDLRVETSMSSRKSRGIYFTPYDVASWMADSCLAPALRRCQGPLEELLNLRVLDPAMGTGRFLLVAAERIAGEAALRSRKAVLDLRRRVVGQCLFGVDRDAFAVKAAESLLCLFAGLPSPFDSSSAGKPSLTPGLRTGDALVEPEAALRFDWEGGFPENFFDEDEEFDGFDAILGNPPYVASKNEPAAFYSSYLGKAGQSDYYLLFIHKYVVRKYLRPGGAVSLIVPDPLLCRGNGEAARIRLLEEVELKSLVHAAGLFPEARVSNVIFLACRARESEEGADPKQRAEPGVTNVTRLESRKDCRSFFSLGRAEPGTFQRDVPRELFRRSSGREFRYLLSGGADEVIRRLDTSKPPPEGRGVILRSLGSVAKARGSVFRGEEVGKEKLRSLMEKSGPDSLPALVGGESIARYAIRDKGFRIPASAVKKEKARYKRQKILIQKSAGRLVAALDTKGFIFPQSVYGILVDDPRIGYPFLLAQLNSRLLNYYLHVMFTGYKLLQPQIEIEDIRRLPVIIPEFESGAEARRPFLDSAKSLYERFLDTDDPGWVLDYVEENLKMGARSGSAHIHDLLDFLGTRMIEASASVGGEPSDESLPIEVEFERLEWLIDLLVYRIFGLDLEQVEIVEEFFGEGEIVETSPSPAGTKGDAALSTGNPEQRDPSLWKRGESHLYGGENECSS